MSNDRVEFAALLEREIRSGVSPETLASTAFDFWSLHNRAIETRTKDILFEFINLENGAEFEMSRSEMLALVEELRFGWRDDFFDRSQENECEFIIHISDRKNNIDLEDDFIASCIASAIGAQHLLNESQNEVIASVSYDSSHPPFRNHGGTADRGVHSYIWHVNPEDIEFERTVIEEMLYLISQAFIEKGMDVAVSGSIADAFISRTKWPRI